MAVHFVLGDKLPLVYEMVMSLSDFSPGWYSYDKSNESEKRKQGIIEYAKTLIDLWGKAFGPENMQGQTPVKTLIRKYLTEFCNIVYTSRKKCLMKMSYRQRIIFYRSMESSNDVLNILKFSVNPNEFDE